MTAAPDNRPLRIGFIHLDLDGAERLVVDAAAVALQTAGHDVTVYTARLDPRRCFAAACDGTLNVRLHRALLPSRIGGRLRHCDRLVLLQAGAIAGIGSFEELYQSNAAFRALAAGFDFQRATVDPADFERNDTCLARTILLSMLKQDVRTRSDDEAHTAVEVVGHLAKIKLPALLVYGSVFCVAPRVT